MILLRILILIIFSAMGYLIGLKNNIEYYGVLIGFVIGSTIMALEYFLKRIELGSIIGGLLGLVIGILLSYLLLYPLRIFWGDELKTFSFIMMSIFGYGGFLIGLSKGRVISISNIVRSFKSQGIEENYKILDTSVIIDGRIADICETGFLEGVFVLPQFILQELQHIADATDPIRRARGRRGLDILHRIQKIPEIRVKIIDEDFPGIKEVDAKLVALAKLMHAKIITNDFNLNKVAGLQGVPVLNINELANALKPVVLPGESMKVFVLKEGKEYNQGVAYLDDGTMVVVENARKHIGKNVDVTVTSVLQTTAGRMIFSKLKEDYEREDLRVAK
jgi:uncharacterized protein YacL